ncbi:MAG: Lead, cadmium, zinc and mercury transporting ATPase, partial [Labilithrix sp.]|nr:Lead, cadmium, zinc and mercury transporting ATPase [Labilithrix sp.]
MESRGRASTTPASASSFCPSCNKPVDVLRAGQVAILDGAFRYFCDATCKNAYVDAVSKRPSLDAMTAEPPAVLSVTRSAQPPVVVSGLREPSSRNIAKDAKDAPFFPELDGASSSALLDDDPFETAAPEPTARPPSVREVARVSEPAPAPIDDAEPESEPESLESDETGDDAEEPDGPPSTLRSPSVTEAEPAVSVREPPSSRGTREAGGAPSSASAGVLAAAPMAGVAAGVLGSVVSLAGEPAGMLRLPLALVAALVVFLHRLFGPRDHGESMPLVVLAPIGASAALATASAVLHHPHADAHASFVGLAAASALTVDILLSRARRDVLAARTRTSRALAVQARVVRGDAVVEVDASLVKPGEQVVVEAGETIPVDGIVVAAGEAEVAPWQDSPALVQKSEGDAVVAGAVVVSGRLRVNATFSGAERAWLRLTQSGKSIEGSAPLVVF